MKQLQVDNYIISTPILEILERLRASLTNGKLRDIKPGPDNIVVTCPIHGGGHENKPACNIYVGDNSKPGYGYFRCFACEASGPFEKFVQACFDSSEAYAKGWLIENFGVPGTIKTVTNEAINIRKAQLFRQHVWEPLDPVILDGYQNYCPYLAKRKLPMEVCQLFNVKYDSKYRQVVFPCYDTKGNLVMTPRRAIDTKTFYIDKNVEKPLYCYHEVVKRGLTKMMVVEGLIDTLTGWAHRVPTVGMMGTPSEFQINLLNKARVNVLYLAFDNDFDGRKFTNQLKRALNKNILIEEVKLPQNVKDVNDLSQEQWDELIKKFNLPQVDYLI